MTRLAAWFFVTALCTIAAPAGATGESANDKALAKQAYDRGLAAHKRSDMKAAAEEFARADELAPSTIALQAALDAAIEADDAPLGAELLERSKREPAPPGLASSITAAHMKFRGRTGKVRVRCPSGLSCPVKIDDRAVEANKIVFARTGSHVLAIVQGNGGVSTKPIEVAPDQLVEVDAVPGGGAPPPPRDTSRWSASTSTTNDDVSSRHEGKGLPKVVFFTGVGLTVIGGVVTSLFALKTSGSHDDFQKAGCSKTNLPQCAGLQSDGRSSQTLTNVALISTLAVGAGSALIGLFFTNWSAPLFGNQGARGGWPLRF